MVLAAPAFLALGAGAWDAPSQYGLGHPASAAEVEAWNIDIAPDGTGLPAGSGTVRDGAAIYAEKCAACHGATGSEGPYETLVGTMSLADQIKVRRRPARTIGNMWPYAPVLFDYVRRTMPFPQPGTLSAEEVYSVVGWLLYRNGLLPADATIDARVLSQIKMPAATLYVPDPRRPWVVE
jgi:cytochrome c